MKAQGTDQNEHIGITHTRSLGHSGLIWSDSELAPMAPLQAPRMVLDSWWRLQARASTPPPRQSASSHSRIAFFSPPWASPRILDTEV